MTNKKSIDNLFDEVWDVEAEILDIVDVLIEAEWDSNTLKQKIQLKMKERDQIEEEICRVI
ncbi:MAG: hypothetical protein VX415_01725 [Thermoproteota archaeon]|jgi:uncharacterized protein (UPF0335 family)|nr:hypothetical protein [Thermoproteota archaeon]|tara:strand:+ start:118 stop:300 length:183 start_codon:yes stop_codon:yes gene_type:complete